MTFDEDQIEMLIYGYDGKDDTSTNTSTTSSFFKSIGNTLLGIVSDVASSSTKKGKETRSEQLKLPAPNLYSTRGSFRYQNFQ